MKLYNYLGHSIHVKTKSGKKYEGYVKHYHRKGDGKEQIDIVPKPITISIDDIDLIEYAEEYRTNKVFLFSLSEIAEQVKEPIEVIEREINRIDHADYQVDTNLTMYDLNTVFEVAANLGKLNMFEWYCDECDAYLNDKDGFEDNNGKWICKECGHENIISKEQLN